MGRGFRRGGDRIQRDRCECGKLKYNSPDDAKRAHSSAGYRIRAYRCDVSRAWHVMNVDKSKP